MYKIYQMEVKDIPELLEMWHNQYLKYCNGDLFPDFWSGGKKEMSKYLEIQIQEAAAIIAKKDEAIVGFMTWMYFDFHNERTAFCPIIGHSAIEDDSQTIYQTLYNYAAQIWVDDDRFNHLWMIFNDDYLTKDLLYDVGFGSYVVDACTKTKKSTNNIDCTYQITKATPNDVDVLLDLVAQSLEYYIDTPIFLKRHTYNKQDIAAIIAHGSLFIAWDEDKPIGFMNLSVSQEYDTETLVSINSGIIDEVGAYIKPEYRGIGIGKSLLNEVTNYCLNNNIPYIHVCFETANPFANKFWRKYFKPIILSVRRTVNKDVTFTNKD